MENVTISFDVYKRLVEALCLVSASLSVDDSSVLKDFLDKESVEKLLSEL